MISLTVAILAAVVSAEPRVLFVSLDGLGYRNLTKDPAARQLTVLHAIRRRGFLAPLQTSFPSKTAAGHAALFTGAWSGVNGIFSNLNPQTPKDRYSLKQTLSGFRSETLTAEPIWTAAARQGVRTVAYQATQLYPFTEASAGKAVAVNGYQSWTMAPARAIRAKDVVDGVWKDGPLVFQVERMARGLRISCGGASVHVPHRPEEDMPPQTSARALARHFSEPLAVESGGVRTAVYFRLFEYGDQDFLLFRTAAQELAANVEGLADALHAAAGPFVGNSATGLYERGAFGKRLFEGGGGSAERRYLETLELCVRQLTRQSIALDERVHPTLFTGYYPVIDDMEHAWFGLSATPGHRAIDRYRAWAYAALNHGLRELVARFSTVVFASDHGMGASTHEIRVGTLLKDLGLSAALVPNAFCMFVNSTDWKDGTVPGDRRNQVVDEAIAKLRATGLFPRFYRKPELGMIFGIGGANGPDFCFDTKPFHYPVEAVREPAVRQYPYPKGEHGFDPRRSDMQSYVLINRRGAGSGGSLRAIDVAPTVAALLGIQPPASAAGRPVSWKPR